MINHIILDNFNKRSNLKYVVLCDDKKEKTQKKIYLKEPCLCFFLTKPVN